MLPSLEGQISNFFNDIRPDNALLFTTFGLDEIALVQLLKKYHVPSKQRIVIYHEIMKHRNPGFLQVHYPYSKVISVELNKKPKGNICPIFHSKIWMEISKTPFRCLKLAVLSANISRYHLDSNTGTKTCESFEHWKGLSTKLPKGDLFDRRLIFEGEGKTRIKIHPATFIVDDRMAEVKIKRATISVFDNLSSLMKENGESLVACAAPFINKTPIVRLGKSNKKVKIWSGNKRDGTRLHIKIIEMRNHIIFGSPNITMQAFGLTKHGIVNHETLVITRKLKSFNLNRDLKGFRRIKIGELDDDEKEPFEDADGINNWVQQKLWTVNGPDSVKLILNEDTGRAEILILGDLHDITKVTIHHYVDDKLSDAILQVSPEKHLRFKTKEQQERLVEAVLSPPILMKGIKSKRVIWIHEINLGEFWTWLENNLDFINLVRSSYDNGDNSRHREYSHGYMVFDDVRDLRLKAYQERKLTSRVQLWHSWICKYGRGEVLSQGIPNWCIELGKQLRHLRMLNA